MTKKLESVGRGINYSETRKVSEKLLPRGLRNFFFQRLRHHFFDLVLCIIFSFSVSTGPPSLFIIIVDFHPLSLSWCRLGCLLIFWMISLLSFGFPYRSSVHPNPIEERYGKAMIWSSKTRGMQQRISIGLYICRVKCSCAVCSELHPSSCMQQHIFRGLWICWAFASHKNIAACTIPVTRWHSATLKM